MLYMVIASASKWFSGNLWVVLCDCEGLNDGCYRVAGVLRGLL